MLSLHPNQAGATQRAVPFAADVGAPFNLSATLEALGDALAPQRRLVHAGEAIYRSGERFKSLHILHAGFVKIVKLAADGREQLVGLRFGGDWMGFDGIADGVHGCDAIAMDTGEVWSVRYDVLLAVAVRHPALLNSMHEAMSREIGRERDALMSICTLPADARVADFLRDWVESAGRRGMRTDQVTLRMTRAEIGNYLGLTLESVSRAFSKLARSQLIAFTEKSRRDVRIPDVRALAAFVQRALVPRTIAPQPIASRSMSPRAAARPAVMLQ